MRYYIDVHDGESFRPDRRGVTVGDLQQARESAIAALPNLKELLLDNDQRYVFVTLRDDEGQRILSASVAMTIDWMKQ